MIKTPLPKSIYISCVPFIQIGHSLNGPKSGRLIEIYPFPTGNQTASVSSKRTLVVWLRVLRDCGA